MKDFVVYTVLTGGYDNILQPLVVDDRFDFILFSNDFDDKKKGIWSIRSIPKVIEHDLKRLSRFPKTHPESLLSEYKASLYIDANIQICDQWVYNRFFELYERQIEYAGIKLILTGRDCIYEHSFDMCQNLLEHDYIAIRQCHELYKRGFPRHFGLNENNVIFRIHTERMKKADEEWWNWITNYSSRDQFSYMYCLWHNNVEINYFLPKTEDTRTSKHFNLIDHDGQPNVIKIKVVKRSLIEKLRIKSKSFNKERNLSKWIQIYKSKHPELLLYVDGIFSIIINSINLIKCVFKK